VISSFHPFLSLSFSCFLPSLVYHWVSISFLSLPSFSYLARFGCGCVRSQCHSSRYHFLLDYSRAKDASTLFLSYESETKREQGKAERSLDWATTVERTGEGKEGKESSSGGVVRMKQVKRKTEEGVETNKRAQSINEKKNGRVSSPPRKKKEKTRLHTDRNPPPPQKSEARTRLTYLYLPPPKALSNSCEGSNPAETTSSPPSSASAPNEGATPEEPVTLEGSMGSLREKPRRA